MADVEIVIVKTPKGFVVRPAYVLASRGDRLIWHNLTGKSPGLVADGEGIDIQIPCGRLGSPSGVGPMRVATTIPMDAPYGFHAYSVYSQRAKGYCKGESTPGVIIKG